MRSSGRWSVGAPSRPCRKSESAFLVPAARGRGRAHHNRAAPGARAVARLRHRVPARRRARLRQGARAWSRSAPANPHTEVDNDDPVKPPPALNNKSTRPRVPTVCSIKRVDGRRDRARRPGMPMIRTHARPSSTISASASRRRRATTTTKPPGRVRAPGPRLVPPPVTAASAAQLALGPPAVLATRPSAHAARRPPPLLGCRERDLRGGRLVIHEIGTSPGARRIRSRGTRSSGSLGTSKYGGSAMMAAALAWRAWARERLGLGGRHNAVCTIRGRRPAAIAIMHSATAVRSPN
jgi:hypothetical protein